MSNYDSPQRNSAEGACERPKWRKLVTSYCAIVAILCLVWLFVGWVLDQQSDYRPSAERDDTPVGEAHDRSNEKGLVELEKRLQGRWVVLARTGITGFDFRDNNVVWVTEQLVEGSPRTTRSTYELKMGKIGASQKIETDLWRAPQNLIHVL